MAKGLVVPEWVEKRIVSIHIKHPKWKIKEIHNELLIELKKQDPSLPKNWPGISTVQKLLASVHKKEKEQPEDLLSRPWSMGTLKIYPLPPDTIPYVLEVWNLHYKLRNFKPPFIPFSIREAIWVSRLCYVIKDDIKKLSMMATIYAEDEEISENLGHTHLNTLELDSDLVNPG